MKKLANILRIISIPPIAAIVLNTILYFSIPEAFRSVWELLILISFNGILPVLSYPLQKRFKIIKSEGRRDASRDLAIIFSVLSYSIGLIIALILSVSKEQMLIYETYFFSGLLMFLFNFIFDVRASGHMCGLAGPLFALIYLLGFQYSYLVIIVVIVAWASIYLGRHHFGELFIGSLLPLISMVLSILIS